MKNQPVTVSGLVFYPVKSCRGISVTTADIGPMGIRYDRQWVVVNENNAFVAQRGDKKTGATGIKTMCLIDTEIRNGTLVLRAPDMVPLALPLEGFNGSPRKVQVWDSISTGIDQGDLAAGWFTEYLSREVAGQYRMVRMPDKGNRTTELGNAKVAFADGYPFLLASDATLASLNGEMAEALPMNRFRPNIVISGCDAKAEDAIGTFSIGGIRFTGIKGCARCPITTIDQETAIAGKEPLRTLATFNKKDGNVFFGMNLVHAGTGRISIGDALVFE